MYSAIGTFLCEIAPLRNTTNKTNTISRDWFYVNRTKELSYLNFVLKFYFLRSFASTHFKSMSTQQITNNVFAAPNPPGITSASCLQAWHWHNGFIFDLASLAASTRAFLDGLSGSGFLIK